MTVEVVGSFGSAEAPTHATGLRSIARAHTNLPVQLSSFIGRDRELEELRGSLGKHRLVTLTGPGGVGKTRLAVSLANRLSAAYRDGVWLVELGSLNEPGLVSQAVAYALGVRERFGQGPQESIVDALIDQQLLLLLDNCEHLLESCAHVADALLRACPDVTVLTTSRQPLGITGEVICQVSTLGLPARTRPREDSMKAEAVRLFIERVGLTGSGVVIADENVDLAADICRRLDGLPLAIELAAARVRALGVEQVARHLDDPLHLLTAGNRVAPERQRTLRGTIEWSYRLLTEPEQRFFACLSVFAGGCDLESAEAVFGEDFANAETALDLLASLVDKSLVCIETSTLGAVRYRMLETLREYARERLQATEQWKHVHEKHARFFSALAERIGTEWLGPHESTAHMRAMCEYDNMRAALRWLIDTSDAEGATRLSASLWRFWRAHGQLTEGRSWLATALKLSDAVELRSSSRREGYKGAGVLAQCQGDYDLAHELLEHAAVLARELDQAEHLATTLRELGELEMIRGHRSSAVEYLSQALSTAHAAGCPAAEAAALQGLADAALEDCDFDAAHQLADQALTISTELGSPRVKAAILNVLGRVLLEQTRLDEAQQTLEEALRIYRELQDAVSGAGALSVLGSVATERHEYTRARELLTECLAVRREAEDREGIAWALEGCARLALAQRWPEMAARLFGAAEALRVSVGAPIPMYARRHRDRCVARIISVTGRRAFDAAWSVGHTTLWHTIADSILEATERDPHASTDMVLTTREWQVVEHLAHGATNRQLAEALVIAPTTAERHVANILIKLGLHTRAEIVRWAAVRGSRQPGNSKLAWLPVQAR